MQKKILVTAAAVCALFLQTSAVEAQTSKTISNRPIKDKWALIVGISKFADSDVPKLKYSVKDAIDFYNYLVKDAGFAPDHVRILLDEKASQRRVMSELGQKFLAQVVKPDDLVVLFFSTHGSPAQMDLRGDNYLVAYDSDPEDLFATGIEMKRVLDAANSRVLTDRVVIVLDACHSGSLKPGSKGLSREVGNFDSGKLAQGAGQLVICSSQPDEQSWESRRYKNGVFTRHLIDAMKSNKTQRELNEAFEDMKTKVQSEVQEDRQAKQIPVLNSNWDGSALVLGALPANPQHLLPYIKESLEPDSVNDFAAKLAIRDLDQDDQSAKEGDGKLILTANYFKEGDDAKELLQSYNRTIRENPRDAMMFYKRACAYIQLKQWIYAHNDLAHAQRVDPNCAHIYLALAYVFHKMKDPVSAARSIEQARFLNPTLPAGKQLPSSIEFGD
ncbi:MAG: caspase family protein [Cyanobacteria bacterium TGS_CYA1]|nr:caspase family protein [Cyanobacteria bacterium TGS_CYA1]